MTEFTRFNSSKSDVKQEPSIELNYQLSNTLKVITASVAATAFSLYFAYPVLIPFFHPIISVIGSNYAIYDIHSSIVYKPSDSEKKTLEIQENLKIIIKDAGEAYFNNNCKLFFDVISTKYDGEFCLFDSNSFNSDFKVEIQNIKRVLFDNGFKPDAIAYFLVIMSDQLLSAKFAFGLSININQEASNLLSAVLICSRRVSL